MVLRNVEETSAGIYKITPDNAPAFSVRLLYLENLKPERLVPVDVPLSQSDSLFMPVTDLEGGKPGVLTDEESQDLLHASLVFAAEVAAMSYLSRAEQSRAGLTKKLSAKGIDTNISSLALDYLESVDFLSDRRFAGAWLRTRSIDHAEGRKRLSAELASRGISREDAKYALDEYFSEHSERSLCERALRKIRRTRGNLDSQKVYASLLRSGFSSSTIKATMNEES